MTLQNTATLMESVFPHGLHLLMVFCDSLSAPKMPFPSLFELLYLFLSLIERYIVTKEKDGEAAKL